MFHSLTHCVPSVPTVNASSLLINVRRRLASSPGLCWSVGLWLPPDTTSFSIGHFPQFKMCFQSLSLVSSTCFESKLASSIGVGGEPSHISGTKLLHDSLVYSSFLFFWDEFSFDWYRFIISMFSSYHRSFLGWGLCYFPHFSVKIAHGEQCYGVGFFCRVRYFNFRVWLLLFLPGLVAGAKGFMLFCFLSHVFADLLFSHC